MVTWKVLSTEDAQANWDRWILEFKDAHIKQSWAWAKLKSPAWQVLPTALLNGSTPMAMALVLLRRAPLGAATIAWINGGPIFRKGHAEHHDRDFLSKYLAGLKTHLARQGRAVLRMNLGIPTELETQLVLRQAGFARPLVPLDTGLTYVVDLGKSIEELRDNLERNWRNQLRQAEKINPEIIFGREQALLERYLPLHDNLIGRKRLQKERLKLAELQRMASELGENIIFMIVSGEGQDGCGGALWTFAGKASFALSSANAYGLSRHLPNFMYWRALCRLKEASLHEFDLTGIDPLRNWGVFNFKRGLKARPVELLGEWEWSSSPWARRAFNLALWLRQDGLP